MGGCVRRLYMLPVWGACSQRACAGVCSALRAKPDAATKEAEATAQRAPAFSSICTISL